MNKQELIEEISERTGINQSKTRTVIDNLTEIIQKSLCGNEPITLNGLGSFQIKNRKARLYHSPNGSSVEIAEHKIPVFKPSSAFVQAIRDGLPTDKEEIHRKAVWYKLLRRIPKVFKKEVLIGNHEYTEEEFECLLDWVSKICKIDLTPRELLGKLTKEPIIPQIFFTTLVEISKRWKDGNSSEANDDESGFWQYVFKTLTGEDATNQTLYIKLTSMIRQLEKQNLFFAQGSKVYYSTLMMHSLSPKSSLNSFFELCFNVFKKDLGYNYSKGDEWLCKLVCDELTSVLGKSSYRKDKKVSIGSSAYSILTGLKSFALHKDMKKHFSSFVNDIFLKINKLYNGFHLQDNSRINNCLEDWWKVKVYSERETTKGERTRLATVSRQNISIKYIREDDSVLLCVPAIRLEDEHSLVAIQIYVDEKERLSHNIHTKRGELVVTSRPCEYKVDELIKHSDNKHIDIRVIITINKEIIFDSSRSSLNSLKRDFILFDDDKETQSQFLKPSNYFLFSPDIDSLKVPEENEINGIGNYLFNIYPESGEILAGENRQVFFMDNSQLGKGIENIFLIGAIEGTTWVSPEGQQYDVFGERVSLMVPEKYNVRGLEIRDAHGFHKLSNFEYSTLKDKMKVYDLRKLKLLEDSQPMEFSLYSFDKGETLLRIPLISLPKLRVKFNRPFYYGDVEKEVVISHNDYSERATWNNAENEVACDMQNGSLHIRIPYLKWRIGGKQWHNEPLPQIQWYKTFMNDGDYLEINMPAYCRGIEAFIKVEGERINIRKTKNDKYEMGRAVYAQESVKQMRTYFIYTDDNDGHKEKMDLFDVSTKAHFTRNPLLYDDGHLFWGVEDTFVGPPNAEFFLSAKQSNDIQYRQKVPNKNLELPDFKDGAYKVVVKILNKSVFLANNYEEIFQGSIIVGAPEKYRFHGKYLSIRRAVYYNGGNRPFAQDYMVKDLKYVKEGDSYYYSGTLCKEEDGRIVELDRMINENGDFDQINPVRIEMRDIYSMWMYNEDIGGLFCNLNNMTLCNIQNENKDYCGIFYYKILERDV